MRSIAPTTKNTASSRQEMRSGRESVINISFPFHVFKERFILRVNLWREPPRIDESGHPITSRKKRLNTTILYGLIFTTIILFFAGLGFVFYLIKSALGIDLLADHHIFGE